MVAEKDVFNRVVEIICIKYPSAKITMDTYLEFNNNGEHLDMSSLEIVDFILDLEREFDMIIDIEDRYYTVGDAVRGILLQLNSEENNE